MFQVTDCSLEPDKKIMAVRFLLFGIMGVMAVYGFISTGSWSLFVLWLVTIVLFLTVARMFICARCEGYGKRCYSMYLGLYSSKLFKRQNKEIPNIGFALEAFSLVVIPLLPLVPLFSFPVFFVIYLILYFASFSLQFVHACRYCAACSNDKWKKMCPAYRAAGRIWKDEIERVVKRL